MKSKPKFKVLIFENGVSNDAFGKYFDKLPMTVVLSTHRSLTKEAAIAVQQKYADFYPNKIKQFHFNNYIPTNTDFDIIIFGPELYEMAGNLARKCPDIKHFVYSGVSSSLTYESENNFTVCTLETMKSTITEMWKERYEPKKEDTPQPSGDDSTVRTNSEDEGDGYSDESQEYSGSDE